MNRDKLRGMFLGLAVGDALGSYLEFKERGTFEEISDYKAGGPFNLPAGYWTDDTSMALCLADSIIEKGGYDSFDVMSKYLSWMKDGYRSSTGRCFDIGTQTKEALERFERDPQVHVNEKRGTSAGNGCIMRLAPVVIACIASERGILTTTRYSAVSARETHFSNEAEYMTELFGGMLFLAATENLTKEEIIRKLSVLRPSETMLKSWVEIKKRTPEELNPTGYVLDTLEVALWAFLNSSSFEDGMLKAINLGGDSDTIGAVYGQLAGAYYGMTGIPQRWIKGLLQSDELINIADKLAGVKDYKITGSRFRADRFGFDGYSDDMFTLPFLNK